MTQKQKTKHPYVLVLALLLALPLFLTSTFTARAASNSGHISGQLLNGTHSNAPVANQEITLQMAQGQSSKDLKTLKTDAKGNFSFTGLDTGKETLYALYTRFQGAHYNGSLLHLDSKPDQQSNLTVYDATNETKKIAILQSTMLLNKPDAQHGRISISAIYTFRNLDNRTYVGSLAAKNSMPNALRFSLPDDSRDLALKAGFDGYQVVQVSKGFASDVALPPGNSQFAFSFNLPYTGSTYNLSYKVVYPTVQQSLLLPPELQSDASGFKAAGVVTASDQKSYRLLQASDLPPENEVHVKLEGLPIPATIADSAAVNDQRWIWLLVGLAILIAVLLASTFIFKVTSKNPDDRPAWLPRRRGSKRNATAETGRHHKSGAHHTQTHPQHKAEDDDREERRKELMKDLMQLDRSYEAGKISKSAYQERRDSLKSRIRRLMDEPEPARKSGRKG